MIWLVVGICAGETLLNVLNARYVRAVGDGDAWKSALLSGLSTLGTFVLWSLILTRPEELGLPGGVALALGSTLGTLFGAKRYLFRGMGPDAQAPRSPGPRRPRRPRSAGFRRPARIPIAPVGARAYGGLSPDRAEP